MIQNERYIYFERGGMNVFRSCPYINNIASLSKKKVNATK